MPSLHPCKNCTVFPGFFFSVFFFFNYLYMGVGFTHLNTLPVWVSWCGSDLETKLCSSARGSCVLNQLQPGSSGGVCRQWQADFIFHMETWRSKRTKLKFLQYPASQRGRTTAVWVHRHTPLICDEVACQPGGEVAAFRKWGQTKWTNTV